MHASQRGSVLLTAIAGILILAVVGAAALSLMTGSVMTVVDGKETVQAAYLAESGKEIVRAQTASQSGGGLMEAAVALTDSREENGGKGLAVDGRGFVRTGLYPSWFRWHNGTWDTTSLGWYGGAPSGERDWLAMSSAGAFRHKGQVRDIDFGTAAADVYLIGRVDAAPLYDASNRTLTVKAKSPEDDFRFFPKSGGLIGLVARRATEKAEATSVSDIRFLYDTMEKRGENYVFSNVTAYPETSSSSAIQAALENHDVALGQYFRVVCESVTSYGARSALIWHTNGRNSLRYAENGGSGGEGVAVGGNKADELLDLFGGSVQGDNPNKGWVTGDNIMGNLKKDDDELEWDYDDKGAGNINGANKDKIETNHFLKQGNAEGNQEYWWVAVASPWLTYDAGKNIPLESMMQYSFEPDDDDDNYFTGIMCRLAFVNASGGLSPEGTVRQGYGAKGIGVGVMQGEITFHKNKDEVKTASVNPALLPGFQYEGNGKFTISPEERAMWYGTDGRLGRPHGEKGHEEEGSRVVLYPLLLVWAYDDLASNTNGESVQSLRPLAVSVLAQKEYLKVEDYLSLTVKVKEEDKKNYLTIWLQEKDDDLIEDVSLPQWPTKEQKPRSGWAYTAEGVSTEADGSLVTAFAVGEAYRRVGIFSEVYPFGSQNRGYADIELGNFFFSGTGSGGGSLFPGGLTPGIVN